MQPASLHTSELRVAVRRDAHPRVAAVVRLPAFGAGREDAAARARERERAAVEREVERRQLFAVGAEHVEDPASSSGRTRRRARRPCASTVIAVFEYGVASSSFVRENLFCDSGES